MEAVHPLLTQNTRGSEGVGYCAGMDKRGRPRFRWEPLKQPMGGSQDSPAFPRGPLSIRTHFKGRFSEAVHPFLREAANRILMQRGT